MGRFLRQVCHLWPRHSSTLHLWNCCRRLNSHKPKVKVKTEKVQVLKWFHINWVLISVFELYLFVLFEFNCDSVYYYGLQSLEIFLFNYFHYRSYWDSTINDCSLNKTFVANFVNILVCEIIPSLKRFLFVFKSLLFVILLKLYVLCNFLFQ